MWHEADRILVKQRTLNPQRMHWGVYARAKDSHTQSSGPKHCHHKQGDWPRVIETSWRGQGTNIFQENTK